MADRDDDFDAAWAAIVADLSSDLPEDLVDGFLRLSGDSAAGQSDATDQRGPAVARDPAPGLAAGPDGSDRAPRSAPPAGSADAEDVTGSGARAGTGDPGTADPGTADPGTGDAAGTGVAAGTGDAAGTPPQPGSESPTGSPSTGSKAATDPAAPTGSPPSTGSARSMPPVGPLPEARRQAPYGPVAVPPDTPDPGAFVDNWADEGHFQPPPAPELPAGTPVKRFGWAGVIGGLTTLVLSVVTPWHPPTVVFVAAGLATLAGFVTLVWQLPDSREDGWDDGARL